MKIYLRSEPKLKVGNKVRIIKGGCGANGCSGYIGVIVPKVKRHASHGNYSYGSISVALENGVYGKRKEIWDLPKDRKLKLLNGGSMKVLMKYLSRSNPGKYYEVREPTGGGDLYCTCWNWKKTRTCRHLENYELLNMHKDIIKTEPKKKKASSLSAVIAREISHLKTT